MYITLYFDGSHFEKWRHFDNHHLISCRLANIISKGLKRQYIQNGSISSGGRVALCAKHGSIPGK